MPPEVGREIFEALKSCFSLKHLNYSFNYIRHRDEDCIEEIVQFISQSKEILHLNFDSTKLNSKDVTAIM